MVFSSGAEGAVTHEFLPGPSKAISEGVPSGGAVTGPLSGVNAMTVRVIRWILMCLVFVVSLGIVAPGVALASAPVVFGGEGEGAGQVSEPPGVAVDQRRSV
jgi:hypothetical protein